MEEKELQQLTEEISIKFFNKPFLHRAYFNPRLRSTGGRYLLGSHNIEVNKQSLIKHGRQELIGIIKHELCHYHLHLEGKGYKHRDKEFKDLMFKVGAPRFCKRIKEEKEVNKSVKYIYICTNCAIRYKRHRKVDVSRYVCGKCKSKISLI